MQNSNRVGIRVTNVSNVSLPSKTPLPSPLNLSFFDTYWIYVPPIQRLFFYSTNTPYNSLIQNFKHSLALPPKILPLTGKLVHSTKTGELDIAFSDGDGVVFIEAESDDSDNFRRLAGDAEHDVAAFCSLVPKLDLSLLPAPLMSVQVTRFAAGGGVVVGISFYHMAVDGRAFWDFMESRADMCRTGGGLVSRTLSHDRTAVGGPLRNGASKLYLETLAPSLPKLTITDPDPCKLCRRTFIVTSKSIRLLKEQSTVHDNCNSAPVSTFVAISTHTWICSMRGKGLKNNETTFFCFPMDCRSLLDDPPVLEGYFGNCVKPCIIRSNGLNLLGQDGYAYTAAAMRNAISEASEGPLRDCDEWAKQLLEIPSSRMVKVAGSPRFTVYETDFGWGRPRRVELVSMNLDGMVVLAEAREGGGVQVSVTQSPTHMEKFAKLFLAGLNG